MPPASATRPPRASTPCAKRRSAASGSRAAAKSGSAASAASPSGAAPRTRSSAAQASAFRALTVYGSSTTGQPLNVNNGGGVTISGSAAGIINLNGGGVPPPSGACGQCKPPVYYFVGSKNPMLSLVKATADHFKRCGHELVWDLGMDMDHPGELQAIFAGPVAERVVAWLDTKRNACIEPRVSAPEEAGAGDGAPGAVAVPSKNPNSVELTSNTNADTGVSQAAPAFGAPDPGSLHSGRALSSTPPPVPGGCGCRPGAVARGPGEASHTSSAWLVVLAAGLVEARRRSHRPQI